MKITKEQFEFLLQDISESWIVYPDSFLPDGTPIKGPLTEHFYLHEEDAVLFGVLKEPKWDGYSDIRAMQHEWFVAELLRKPIEDSLMHMGIYVESENEVDNKEG